MEKCCLAQIVGFYGIVCELCGSETEKSSSDIADIEMLGLPQPTHCSGYLF
jgi:hypothetical protein